MLAPAVPQNSDISTSSQYKLISKWQAEVRRVGALRYLSVNSAPISIFCLRDFNFFLGRWIVF